MTGEEREEEEGKEEREKKPSVGAPGIQASCLKNPVLSLRTSHETGKGDKDSFI